MQGRSTSSSPHMPVQSNWSYTSSTILKYKLIYVQTFTLSLCGRGHAGAHRDQLQLRQPAPRHLAAVGHQSHAVQLRAEHVRVTCFTTGTRNKTQRISSQPTSRLSAVHDRVDWHYKDLQL